MALKILGQFKPILTRDSRYKMFVYTGGRGGGKTIGIADSIITLCVKNKEFAFCGREIQKSTDDSTAQVVKDRLNYWTEQGLLNKNFYKINNTKIIFINGSVINFVGFSNITIDNLKSTPCTLIWVDEAHSLSKTTIDTLRPSVRTTNSANEQPLLIFSFNRKLINDPILVEAQSRTDCLLTVMNYYDNPFFETNIGLTSELEQDKQKLINGSITQAEFNNIWLGLPFVDEEVLINYDLIKKCEDYRCTDSHLYLPTFGLDIAREGKDASVLTICQGHKILEQIEFRGIDGSKLAEKVISYYNAYNDKEDKYNKNKIKIHFDFTGIGCSFRDAVRRLNYEFSLIPVEGAARPDDPRYFNKRAECYCRLKDVMVEGLEYCENHNELMEQLSYIPIDLLKDKIKLVDKNIIKKKLGRSPDNADSLALCYSSSVNKLRDNGMQYNYNQTSRIQRTITNEDVCRIW